ncbi:MAG: orotidine-5'-phosphate decarboxylase [Actinomycetota bacterium]
MRRIPDDPLCVALDLRGRGECERLAAATEDHAGLFKVGLTAFYSAGPELVRSLAARRPVFADLKLHDIPAQVATAVDAVVALGASYVTVHALGGSTMIEAAVASADDRIDILAVTVLTSLDDDSLRAIGVERSMSAQVLGLAESALAAGASGLVCSPLEVAPLRSRFGRSADGGPVLVVPGIRPRGAARDDQRRVASAGEAFAAGADVLVVGRPISGAPDPGEAARALNAEIGRVRA